MSFSRLDSLAVHHAAQQVGQSQLQEVDSRQEKITSAAKQVLASPTTICCASISISSLITGAVLLIATDMSNKYIAGSALCFAVGLCAAKLLSINFSDDTTSTKNSSDSLQNLNSSDPINITDNVDGKSKMTSVSLSVSDDSSS